MRNNEKAITDPRGRPDLRARRKAIGLSLRAVAAAIGCDVSLLAKVERGGRCPYTRVAARCDEALAVAERTARLPDPPARSRTAERETRVDYCQAPARCVVCGDPLTLRPNESPSHARRRRYCLNPCRGPKTRRYKPGHRAVPITSPTGRPDLRARRVALGLTAQDLARLAGRDATEVLRVERGAWGWPPKPGVCRPETVARFTAVLDHLEAARR